ncbi:MAG TPA: histidine phosphatase family protein [Actinomycetales bacterium]|jgi:probable phosphoglycerate mutase
MSGGRVVLVRHGQTEWARDGRHTGLTDIPLTELGERQARAAGVLVRELLGGREPALVLTSPLVRAAHTAELAGLTAEVEPRLVEWDYGGYEGLTSPQIQQLADPGWTVFGDGVIPGPSSPGETLEQVAARVEAVLERAREALPHGDVVLVAHGHSLRVLGACWLGAGPALGARLLLDTAGVCVLAHSHDLPGIQHWNLTATVAHVEV